MVDTPTAPKATSYADRVDYKALFKDLSHYHLTPEEEDYLKKSADKHLKDWDGGKLVTNNLGAMFTSFIHDILAFVKNILGGPKAGDESKGFFDKIGSTFSNAADNTGKQSDLAKLDQATIRIYVDLKNGPGKLPSLAARISGQSDEGAPPPSETGIYTQIRKTLDIPQGMRGTLSSTDVPSGANLSAPQFSGATKNTPLTRDV